MTRARNLLSEQGTTLVYLAVILVALLGFIALAVDGGLLYGERQKMQSAADAAAMAGAERLCRGMGASVAATAQSYATLNGADEASVQVDGWRVRVTARKTVETYFAKVLGIAQVTVGARAEAACSEAASACRVWPLGLNRRDWEGQAEHSCGDLLYIWTGGPPMDRPDCDVYDCDLDGDGDDDIFIPEGPQNRPWLDFTRQVTPDFPDSCSQPGIGAAELRCEILRGSGARIETPACVDRGFGSRASVGNAINARRGDRVAIALYDGYCPRRPGPGSRPYRVTAFGCVTVEGWVRDLRLTCQATPRDDEHGGDRDHDHEDDDHDHEPARCRGPLHIQAIAVRIPCNPMACFTPCGSLSGNPPRTGGVNAVGLIK